MMLVAPRDLANPVDGLLHAVKRQDAVAHWKNRRKPSVLHDDWPAGSEIAGRSIAEPTRLPDHVAIFGDGPLRLRRLDVLAVTVDVRAHLVRIDDLPALEPQVRQHGVWQVHVPPGTRGHLE